MKQLEDAMNKEVTRKEFLTTLGFGLASILGFSGIVKLIFSKGANGSPGVSRGGYGYGSSNYGGGRESRTV